MLRKTLDQLPFSRPYLVVTIATIALFWPTWLRLVNEWLKWEQVLAHGLPTFLIFIGLLIVHPPRPADQHVNRFSVTGGVVLILTVVAWGLLELVRIDTLAYLMLPAGLLAACWTLLGFRAMVRFLPYVILFGLSLPIWSDLVPLLIKLATAVVTKVVAMMGITALIEGPNITLPYGRLVIADGCSGIRYFAVSLLLAMLTSILNDFRWKGWLASIAVGMMIGLLVNWVRIAALVVIAYQSRMESGLVADHETFGWVIYAAFVVPVALLAPVHRRNAIPTGKSPVLSFRGAGFVILAFLVGPLGISLAHSAATKTPAWDIVLEGKVKSRPDQLPLPINFPDQLDETVWRLESPTWVSIGQYQKDSRNDKLVPYLPRLVNTDQWYLERSLNDGNLKVYQHLANRKRVVMTQRYQVGTRRTDSYIVAKLLQIPAVLTGQSRFALITIQGPCSSRDCERASTRVQELGESFTLKPSK